jgi:hypothetical protein
MTASRIEAPMISTGFFRASPGALVLDAMVLACVSDPRGARLALVCAAEPGDPGAGQHVAIHDPARGTCVLLRATADGRLFAAWAGDLVAVLHAPPGEEPSTLALYDPTDATLVREVSLGARASDTFGHWDSKGAAALEAATDAPIVVAWEADWLSRSRYARAYSVPELRLQGEAFLEADDTWEEPYCWRPVERLPAAVSADGTRFAEVSISAPHRRYALRQDAPTLVRWDLREDVRRATELPLGEDPEGWNCKVFGTLGPDVILAAHGWSSGHERLVLTSVPLAPTPTDHAPEPTPVTRS